MVDKKGSMHGRPTTTAGRDALRASKTSKTKKTSSTSSSSSSSSSFASISKNFPKAKICIHCKELMKRGKEPIGNCFAESCGNCSSCKNMHRFGGPGTKRQKCIHRVCKGKSRNKMNPLLPLLGDNQNRKKNGQIYHSRYESGDKVGLCRPSCSACAKKKQQEEKILVQDGHSRYVSGDKVGLCRPSCSACTKKKQEETLRLKKLSSSRIKRSVSPILPKFREYSNKPNNHQQQQQQQQQHHHQQQQQQQQQHKQKNDSEETSDKTSDDEESEDEVEDSDDDEEDSDEEEDEDSYELNNSRTPVRMDSEEEGAFASMADRLFADEEGSRDDSLNGAHVLIPMRISGDESNHEKEPWEEDEEEEDWDFSSIPNSVLNVLKKWGLKDMNRHLAEHRWNKLGLGWKSKRHNNYLYCSNGTENAPLR